MEIDVVDHIGLAHFIAHKYKYVAEKLNIEYAELYQVALIGIWKATQKNDPSKGFTFATFASSCATNAIKMHLRSHTVGKYQVGNPIGEKEGYLDRLPSRLADADFKEVDLRLSIKQIAEGRKFKSAVKQRIINCLLNGDSANAKQLSKTAGCTASYAYAVLQDLGVQLNMAQGGEKSVATTKNN